MKKCKKIVVFDFDGTLIKKDSIKLYCKWLSFNIIEYYFVYHLWFRLLKIFNSKFDLKLERVKFYYNRQIKTNSDIKEFNNILNNNIFQDSLEIIKANKLKYDVFIVSASFFEIISSFCSTQLNVNLIVNKIENYTTKNDINYKNKILVLGLNIKSDYKIIKGYGNSVGDFDFMKISETSYLRKQNGQLVEWQK